MDMDDHQRPDVDGDGQPVIDPINIMGVQPYSVFSSQDQQQMNLSGDSLLQRVFLFVPIDCRDRRPGAGFLSLRTLSSALGQPTISSLAICSAS